MRATVEMFKEEDAVYVRLKNTQVTSGKDHENDPSRHLDFDQSGDLVGVLFMNVSNGVDLDVLPDEVQEEVNTALQPHSIPVLA